MVKCFLGFSFLYDTYYGVLSCLVSVSQLYVLPCGFKRLLEYNGGGR